MPAFAGFSFSPLPEGFLPQSERVKAPLSQKNREEQQSKSDELRKPRFRKTIARSNKTNSSNLVPQNKITAYAENHKTGERNV